ncbi:MAG TPA: tetratricopeptide repeat protein, partial [Gemmatimonadaceae bacterium]
FCGYKAQCLASLGRLDDALGVMETAFTLVERTGERLWDADLHRIRGDLLAARGDGDAAVASYMEAIAIAQRQGALTFERRAAEGLARVRPGAEARLLSGPAQFPERIIVQ